MDISCERSIYSRGRAGGDVRIATIETLPNYKEAYANARAIVAIPELLKALGSRSCITS